MDAHPPLRQPRAPVVPTGIPHGVDAVVGAIRSGRPTRQVPQRSGHAHQPPRCSTGCGTPQAGRVDAQRPLAGLIEGVRRPPLPIQATARVGAPVHAMGDPHDRASRPRLGFTTHDDAHRATSAARDQASKTTTPQGTWLRMAASTHAMARAMVVRNGACRAWNSGSWRHTGSPG